MKHISTMRRPTQTDFEETGYNTKPLYLSCLYFLITNKYIYPEHKSIHK